MPLLSRSKSQSSAHAEKYLIEDGPEEPDIPDRKPEKGTPKYDSMMKGSAACARGRDSPLTEALLITSEPALTSMPAPEPYMVHGCKKHRDQALPIKTVSRLQPEHVHIKPLPVAPEPIERITHSGRMSRVTRHNIRICQVTRGAHAISKEGVLCRATFPH